MTTRPTLRPTSRALRADSPRRSGTMASSRSGAAPLITTVYTIQTVAAEPPEARDLERIARESAVDHGPIVEVLTTYAREHSPWPPSRPGQYRAEAPVQSVPALRTRAADVQAALIVI